MSEESDTVVDLDVSISDRTTDNILTPRGGTKRFLTPSPVHLTAEQLLTKRTRQFTGESEISADNIAMPGQSEEHDLTHMGSDDITKVAYKMKNLMFPEIKEMLREQLREDIPKLIKEAVTDATKSLTGEIANLKSQNNLLQNENSNLRKSVKELNVKVNRVELLADSNEQYSRRNSLRIAGIPTVEGESTDAKVIELANDMGVNISESDIDRSHRVGPFRRGQRALIVKFTSYRARQKLFAIRKDLRKSDKHRDVFINEDITSRRSKLLFSARQLVRERRLRAAYTSDGKIFVKDNDGEKHHITSTDQMTQFSRVQSRAESDDGDGEHI